MGSCPPQSSDTLEVAALKVLNEGDPWVKAQYGEMAARLWLDGSIALAYDACTLQLLPVPDRPARLPIVTTAPLPRTTIFLVVVGRS